MSKSRVAIICGGKSSEHEISCVSANGILNAIDRNKFEPVLIGITKSGKWLLLPDDSNFSIVNGALPTVPESGIEVSITSLGLVAGGKQLAIDVAFPVLHGPYGEDGTIQGLFEMIGIKYVGSGVLASAVSMDKSYAKPIFAAAGLSVAAGIVVTSKNFELPSNLTFPLFVKPARSGSSRGTTKVKQKSDLASAVEHALSFDTKVIIEQAVVGKEIECAVLQADGKITTSELGQISISSKFEFYDFQAKYLDNSMELIVPADLPAGVQSKIQQAAITAFNAAGCEGLARVDFFYSTQGEIIINEINTMPGFTPTSVYPKLIEKNGINYQELITKLITTAQTRSASITR
uniref:D-alanine--D-alanine ligase family protein n=1 Tax=Candidatus Nanopelagicus sp. TaxID=2518620 RepID=UPI00404919D1